MKKTVDIKIKSLQQTPDGNTSNEFTAVGTLGFANGSYYIIYAENSDIGFEGCNVTVKISNGQISVVRQGAASSALMFEAGKHTVGRYSLDEGTIELEIFTHMLENSLTEQGGSLYWSYTLLLDAVELSKNELYIYITEK